MDDHKENLPQSDADLWVRYRETRSISNRNKIVEQYLPWATHKAYSLIRKRSSAVSIDDYISEAAIGLIRAVESYDPSRGVRFFAYANKFIWGQIMNYVGLCGRYSGWRRHTPKTIQLLSLDNDTSEYNNRKDNDDFIDTSADDPIDRVQQQELKELIFWRMPRRDKKLLTMIYYKGIKQRDIAKRLKTNEKAIWRIKREAIDRLKRKPALQEYWLLMIN